MVVPSMRNSDTSANWNSIITDNRDKRGALTRVLQLYGAARNSGLGTDIAKWIKKKPEEEEKKPEENSTQSWDTLIKQLENKDYSPSEQSKGLIVDADLDAIREGIANKQALAELEDLPDLEEPEKPKRQSTKSHQERLRKIQAPKSEFVEETFEDPVKQSISDIQGQDVQTPNIQDEIDKAWGLWGIGEPKPKEPEQPNNLWEEYHKPSPPQTINIHR